MRKIISLFFVAVFIFYCNSVIAQSTTQILIKALDGTTKLNGGSVVPGHIAEIEAFSFSQGESGCPNGTIGCHSSTSDFNFMMALNPASISFKKLLYGNTALTSVDVYFRQSADGFTYYRIHMENVIVTSVQESGSSEKPYFAISLTPAKIAWWQKNQNADGSGGAFKSYGWDVAQNIEWNYVFP